MSGQSYKILRCELILIVISFVMSGSPASPACNIADRDLTRQPFSSDSPWNTKISNKALFQTIESPGFDINNGATINTTLWTEPVYIGKATDRVVRIHPDNKSLISVHMPEDISVDPSSDAALNIVDETDCTVVEMWKVKSLGVRDIFAEVAIRNSLYDGGVYDKWHGARAYGGSAIGGLLRNGELNNGIHHALAAAVRRSALNAYAPDGRPYVWPASSADSDFKDSYSSVGNLFMGSRMAMPMEALKVLIAHNVCEKNLLLAFAVYGLIIVDTSSSNLALYSEPSERCKDYSIGSEFIASAVRQLRLVK